MSSGYRNLPGKDPSLTKQVWAVHPINVFVSLTGN
jgi:hypothetical protein